MCFHSLWKSTCCRHFISFTFQGSEDIMIISIHNVLINSTTLPGKGEGGGGGGGKIHVLKFKFMLHLFSLKEMFLQIA